MQAVDAVAPLVAVEAGEFIWAVAARATAVSPGAPEGGSNNKNNNNNNTINDQSLGRVIFLAINRSITNNCNT
jgi:hypothetical protein